MDLARELKNLRNMKVTEVPIVVGALETIQKGIVKGLEELEIGGQAETIQTKAFSSNTQKTPVDLRILAVTQTSVKDHQLTGV